jgi:hypothetical protein
MAQRYVSKELTHFVGRGCRKPDGSHDEDAQYALLVKILREGCLLHRLDCPDGPARCVFHGGGSFGARTMIHVDAVCFCDIPAPDLAIHMEKYRSFGLSFLKSFLVRQGANPGFYVASDSVVPNDTAAKLFYRGLAEGRAPQAQVRRWCRGGRSCRRELLDARANDPQSLSQLLRAV